MKVLISFLFIFLMSYFYVSAQSTLFSPKDTIRIHLTIGKSSDNTFTKEKEAEVVGTFPDSDTLKSSWLSNAYLEFGLTSDSSGWSFGFIGELHKNTLVEKEQDVRQYGLSFGKIFTTSKQNLITSEIPTSLTIKYSENKIKETNIFQIIGGLSYNRFRGPAFLKTQTAFPRYKSTFGKLLRFSHSHNLGFAYLGADENVLLGQFDFELNTYLLPLLSDIWINKLDLFRFQFLYKGRTELLGSTDLNLDSFIDFQIGINYPFDKKNSIGIAYDWIQGADPLKGLDDQKYQTFTVKVKLVIK